MSTLNISGLVIGINTQPITNASIKIIDTDVGSSNDTIFRGTTNSEGVFRGRSSDWSDANWINSPAIPPFIPSHRIPTPDLLSLEFEVRKADEIHKGPFIHIANSMSVPIICPWNNPQQLFARIENENFFDAESTASKIKELVDNNTNFDVEIFDPIVKRALSPLIGGSNVQRRFFEGQISGFSAEPVSGIALSGTAVTLFAVAAIILAVGASISTIIIAYAIIYAINKGCSPDVDHSTSLDLNGSVKETTKVKYGCG